MSSVAMIGVDVVGLKLHQEQGHAIYKPHYNVLKLISVKGDSLVTLSQSTNTQHFQSHIAVFV